MRTVLRKVQSQANLYHQKLVDEVASALLEDSTNQQSGFASGHKATQDSRITGSRFTPVTTKSPDVLQTSSPVFGVDQIPDSGRRNIQVSPYNKQAAAAPVKRTSPPIPLKSSRRYRKASLRHQRASSRGSDSPGYTKPLPKSHTSAVNPLRLNPPVLSASSSVLLDDLAKYREVYDSLLTGSGRDGSKEVEDLPKLSLSVSQNSLPSKPSISKASRVTEQRSVFKKMTHALAGRFYGRPQAWPRARGQKGVKIGIEETPIVEGRKSGRGCFPPNEDPKSTRTRNIYDDPFEDPIFVNRAPTEFETRLRKSSFSSEIDQSIVPSLPTRNPFETERVFESSIDSLLPSSPLATSTPRARSTRLHVVSDSPTKKSRHDPTADPIGASLHAGTPSLNAHTEDLSGEPDTQVLQPMNRNGFCVVNPRGRARLGYMPVLGSQDRKKHPSPNKSDLELLGDRFRKQFPRLILNSPDENDETVEPERDFSSPSSADPLAMEDDGLRTNTLPRNATKHTEAIFPSTTSPPVLRRQRHRSDSRPYPAPLTRSRAQTRVAMHGHPRSSSLESDELQWDMKASSLGMNAVC